MGAYLASLAALFAAGMWALGSHWIGRHLRGAPGPDRPSAASINALRLVVGLTGFAVLWGLLRGPAPTGQTWLALAASGVLGFAIGDGLYFAALPRCGVQTAAMVGLLNVPLAALLGWVWLGQDLDALTVASMGIVVLGVVLVLRDRPDVPSHSRRSGALFALAAAVCWAAGTIGGHAAIQGVDVFAGAFARLVGAALGATVIAALVGVLPTRRVGAELASLVRPLRRPALLRALIPGVLCASILNLIPFHFALRELPGAIGALLFSTTPLFTLPLARAFGEPVGRRAVLGTLIGLVGVAGVVLASVEPPPELAATEVEAPESAGARWPDVAVDGEGRAALSWLEPGAPNRLRLAVREANGWTAPRTLAAGDGWFDNWADFPQLAFTGGRAAGAWLEKLGRGTFAYGVRLARDGAEPVWLHDDTSPTEHGFVSLVPLAGEELFCAWLDGRGMADGGPMALRARRVGGPEHVLDERVCECCQTDAARLDDGRVLVAWRDRDADEVRDIAWSVGDPAAPGSFGAPRLVHSDGWQVPGCPVNGPAVAASGGRAAIAWFTREDGAGRVRVAFARRGVTGFAAPLRVDEGRGAGRVDACWLDEHLVVAWLEEVGTGAEWRARALTADGRMGPAVTIAAVSGERADGFLRMAREGDALFAAFRDSGEDRLRVFRVASR